MHTYDSQQLGDLHSNFIWVVCNSQLYYKYMYMLEKHKMLKLWKTKATKLYSLKKTVRLLYLLYIVHSVDMRPSKGKEPELTYKSQQIGRCRGNPPVYAATHF